MNLMEEDDLTPDQIDKMYELFADKGIDIIGDCLLYTSDLGSAAVGFGNVL